MPSLRVLLAPLAGVLIALRISDTLNRQVFLAESPLPDNDLRAALKSHHIVHIGGQHRGGTTLLLNGLATHPHISVHALGTERQEAGAVRENAEHLHGEGIFLQNVYPRSSLDHQPQFFLRRRVARFACTIAPSLERVFQQQLPQAFTDAVLPWVGCTLREGIGGYAISHSSHLGSDHPLASEEGALRLFRQWAPHWDLRRPVLLEKSPSNARAIGMLSAMWAAGRTASFSFVFISRHPLPQSFAMLAFVEPADVSLHSQLEHYLAVEESVRNDARRHLSAVALLSLEGLAARPQDTLHEVLQWLGLSLPSGDSMSARGSAALLKRWADSVRPSPNELYIEKYRAKLAAEATARERHDVLVNAFSSRVAAATGYILAGPVEYYAHSPKRDEAWRREWAGQSDVEVTVM